MSLETLRTAIRSMFDWMPDVFTPAKPRCFFDDFDRKWWRLHKRSKDLRKELDRKEPPHA